jgi:hypothetical protein
MLRKSDRRGGGMDVFADGYIPTLSQTLRFDSIVSNSFVCLWRSRLPLVSHLVLGNLMKCSPLSIYTWKGGGRELIDVYHCKKNQYSPFHCLNNNIPLWFNWIFFPLVFQFDFEERIGADAAQVPPGHRFRSQQRSHESLHRTKGPGFTTLPSR